jgi:hypothetical protein
MSEREPLRRDAITRARFFVQQARSCRISDDNIASREAFEAYLEAAISFGRSAIQRLQAWADRRMKGDPSWKTKWKKWWGPLEQCPAIQFFRQERNRILHEAPPRIGQTLHGPGPLPEKVEAYYFYEDPSIPATDTIERHLNSVEEILADAEARFGIGRL